MKIFDGTIKYTAFSEGHGKEMECQLMLYRRDHENSTEYIALVSDMKRFVETGSVMMNELQVLKTIEANFNITNVQMIIYFPGIGVHMDTLEEYEKAGIKKELPNQTDRYVFNKIILDSEVQGSQVSFQKFPTAFGIVIPYTEVEEMIGDKLFL